MLTCGACRGTITTSVNDRLEAGGGSSREVGIDLDDHQLCSPDLVLSVRQPCFIARAWTSLVYFVVVLPLSLYCLCLLLSLLSRPHQDQLPRPQEPHILVLKPTPAFSPPFAPHLAHAPLSVRPKHLLNIVLDPCASAVAPFLPSPLMRFTDTLVRSSSLLFPCSRSQWRHLRRPLGLRLHSIPRLPT